MTKKFGAKPSVPTPGAVDAFINGAPDAPATPKAAPAVPLAEQVRQAPASSGRKQLISLTIEPSILQELDRVARSLGLSRAGAVSLAVSKFIAQEKKEM